MELSKILSEFYRIFTMVYSHSLAVARFDGWLFCKLCKPYKRCTVRIPCSLVSLTN